MILSCFLWLQRKGAFLWSEEGEGEGKGGRSADDRLIVLSNFYHLRGHDDLIQLFVALKKRGLLMVRGGERRGKRREDLLID